MNKNYEEAIEMFTKAIEADESDPVFFNNSTCLPGINRRVGAAVRIAMEDFEGAVADCDQAIAINGGFVKVLSMGVDLVGVLQEGAGAQGEAGQPGRHGGA